MAVYDDLQQLFALQAETLAVEFKGWLNLSTAEGRAPLAKAAIALATMVAGRSSWGCAKRRINQSVPVPVLQFCLVVLPKRKSPGRRCESSCAG